MDASSNGVNRITADDFLKRVERGEEKRAKGEVTFTQFSGDAEITYVLPDRRKLHKDLAVVQNLLMSPQGGLHKRLADAKTEPKIVQVLRKHFTGETENALDREEAIARVYSRYIKDVRDPEVSPEGGPSYVKVNWFDSLEVDGFGDDLPPDSVVEISPELIETFLVASPKLMLMTIIPTIESFIVRRNSKRKEELGNSVKSQSGTQPADSPAANAEKTDEPNLKETNSETSTPISEMPSSNNTPENF